MCTRVAILLSVTLALANAECFTRCVAERVDQNTNQTIPPCHSHGHAPGTTHATPQHNLRPSAAVTVQASGRAVLAPVSEMAERELVAALAGDGFEVRPPPLVVISPIPLRV